MYSLMYVNYISIKLLNEKHVADLYNTKLKIELERQKVADHYSPIFAKEFVHMV